MAKYAIYSLTGCAKNGKKKSWSQDQEVASERQIRVCKMTQRSGTRFN